MRWIEEKEREEENKGYVKGRHLRRKIRKFKENGMTRVKCGCKNESLNWRGGREKGDEGGLSRKEGRGAVKQA